MRKPARRAAVMAAILAALAGQAGAQDRTADCAHLATVPEAHALPIGVGARQDALVLAPHGTSARLCYHNHEAQVSRTNSHLLTIDALTVRVDVTVEQGSERLTITPPAGWMVFPADYADAPVADGSALTVMLISGLM